MGVVGVVVGGSSGGGAIGVVVVIVVGGGGSSGGGGSGVGLSSFEQQRFYVKVHRQQGIVIKHIGRRRR